MRPNVPTVGGPIGVQNMVADNFNLKGDVVIEIEKLESIVVYLAAKGMPTSEIAEQTRLKVQSVKKLLETAVKRLGKTTIRNPEGSSLS